MNIRLLLQDCHDRIQGGARASEWFLPFSVESAWGPPSPSRLSHDSLTLAFCLATRRCMNLDPSLLVGLHALAWRQLANLRSVWSGSLAAVASDNPIEPLAKLGRHAQKDFKCRSNFSPFDF